MIEFGVPLQAGEQRRNSETVKRLTNAEKLLGRIDRAEKMFLNPKADPESRRITRAYGKNSLSMRIGYRTKNSTSLQIVYKKNYVNRRLN